MALSLAALALIAALTAGGIGGINAISNSVFEDREKNDIEKIKNQYGLSQDEAEFLQNELAGTPFNLLDPSTYFQRHGTDLDTLQKYYEDYLKVADKIGTAPEAPNLDLLNRQADDTIAAENAQLNNLYDQTFNRTENLLNQSLAENNAMFSDYRNQVLTNQALNQQAIAGSTRYELDRQQRNAISRGASAAQRLVSNINAQLGLQAQSAQQSLDTSNVLAQQLLAQRQAQQGIRSQYLDAMNTRDTNRANLIKGSAERGLNYRQGLKGEALNDYQTKLDLFNENVDTYLRDNPYADVIKNRRGTL